jgi:coproporphyrinogen III oxidase-like Fe-S oxidoreductase
VNILDRLIMRGARFAMARAMRIDTAVDAAPEPPTDAPIGLYLHVPFCTALCPFCPFHRQHHEPVLAAAYFDALGREIAAFEDRGFRFDDVYVGGGTPTVEARRLGELLAGLRQRHPIRTIAVETNPNHLVGDHLDPLVDAGVNRLSVGVQSLDDAVLQKIGRLATYGTAAAIEERLTAVFDRFETVNVDMMFNLPEQPDVSVERDLERLLALAPPQISWYPLMPPHPDVAEPIEPARAGRTTLRPGDFDRVAFGREKALYERISARLEPAYARTSVWCFDARSRTAGAADEYIIEAADYLGLGSGAFSLLGRDFRSETFDVGDYLRRVEAHGHGMNVGRTFSASEKARYLFLTRLFGERWSGTALRRDLGARWRWRLAPLLQVMRLLGAFAPSTDGLALSARGRYWWLVLMREFFMQVNAHRARRRILDAGTAEPLVLARESPRRP